MSEPAVELDPARRQTATQIERLRRRAPSSIAAHASLIHRDDRDRRLVPAEHHALMIEVLEDPATYPYVAFILPPGYGKSTFVSVVYPTWRIGMRKGRIRMGIICSTATLATDFSGAVMDAIRSPAFRATYPDVQPDYERGWARNGFYVTGTPPGPSPTLIATGIRGPIIGRRLDEIVLDDPTTFEDARSEDVMEKQRGWLKNTLIQRLPAGMRPPKPQREGGRIIAALTRWGDSDLVPTLVDLGFVVIHLPALATDAPEMPDLLGRVEGEPLWPEVEDVPTLVAMREESEIWFELVYQGNVTILKGDIFDPLFFQRGQPPMRPGELDKRGRLDFIAQYVDTAGAKSQKKGDYFAMVTIGVRGGEFWVLDVERGRFQAPEQEVVVNREAAEWRPDTIVIEDTNEGRALYQNMVLKYRLPLKPYSPTEPKDYRAIPLANAYRAYRVWHPEDAAWRRVFETELEAFPRGRHDDQVDAATGAFNHTGADRGMRVRELG